MGTTARRLTRTPPEVPLARLSAARYREVLAAAQAQERSFVRFWDLRPDAPPPPEDCIALRHDVDFSPGHALALAELEHSAGVAATYFFLVDGGTYDPLDPEVVGQIRRIGALGHEVGLHFALAAAAHAGLGDEVAFRLRLLSAILDGPVRSFSQHDPVNSGFADVILPPGHPPCVDAYAAARAHDMLYVSDSAMMWREHSFESALQEPRRLCLVAHPHSWLHPEEDYVALIRDLEEREVERTRRAFEDFVSSLPRYYERRLREGA